MRMRLRYGKGFQELNLGIHNLEGILKPLEMGYTPPEKEEIVRALCNPIASKRLREIINPEDSIVIVTSDITRPMPSYKVLPHLLQEIQTVSDLSKVTVVFAIGSHRKHTVEEMKMLVGEDVYHQVRCVDADPDDCVRLGETKRGTPVDIYKAVARADKVICLGNVEYHYFAGYSGGAKAIMPGVSSREAIQANHSAMVYDNACTGRIEGNPVRQDIEEVLKFKSVDFILNVVLDENKRIIKAVAGDCIEAHREACRFLDRIYKVRIQKKADIVVVSAGGFPKDINLYQAQKALDNAYHAVADGGVIILLAACQEGLGESVFEEWMTSAEKPEDLVQRIKKKFELGGHKAAAIGKVLQKADIYLVSDMDRNFVGSLFLKPYRDVKAAFMDALKKKGKDAGVIIMPFGGSTLPYFKPFFSGEENCRVFS